MVPVALAQDSGQELMSGKKGLTLLNYQPLNAETPAHFLDDDVTPYERMFIRANGLVPQSALGIPVVYIDARWAHQSLKALGGQDRPS
jgi:hypothetical protein